MWSFFSRDAVKDFNYEIGPEICHNVDTSIWKLHSGKKKSGGDNVSIFIFEVNSPETQDLLNIAKASVKRLKTLRHPSILTYIDSLETDKLVYLVTERVEPLPDYLNRNDHTESQKNLAISWGIYQIASGLGFLNKDCNLSHNNVCMGSVFVDRAGEWKLSALEHVMPCKEKPPMKVIPALKKYNPPELEVPSTPKVHNWSYDSWGLGCLIWEAFNGFLNTSSSLKNCDKIPANLTSCFSELINEDPLLRPNTLAFLKKAYRPRGFFRNRLVETMLFLREIHIKENDKKVSFFNNLSPALDSFPRDICLYKVLPELINAFEFGNAGSCVLSPMFKLGKYLSDEEYQKKIVPCIVKMFSSKDRAMRAKLLQQMEDFIHHFSSSIINSQIFPNVAQGFLDTSPTIREYTIKCIFFLAPKLNYQNLNVEVLKHLARSQTKDEQGGIRSNTTVCLGKIASYLHPQVRRKILITAFLRALRDPFPPARIAAIVALSATEMYYSINECATRILPALCHFTVDPEKSVRDQAFKSISGFIKKLQKVSEDPTLVEEMEKELHSMTPSEVAASWTSWAVTSIVDKLHVPVLKKTTFSSSPNITSSDSDPKAEEKLQESQSLDNIEMPQTSPTEESPPKSSGLDGWESEWQDEAEFSEVISSADVKNVEAANEWDTDDWESFERLDDLQDVSRPVTIFSAKDNSDDLIASGITTQTSKLKLTKSTDNWNISKENWGDWDEPSSAEAKMQEIQSHHTETEVKNVGRPKRLVDGKLEREEKQVEKEARNAERQKRLEEKQKRRVKDRPPRKLGGHKLS